ncbi:unnamed protein product, partial [Sphacelaria rigidula]
GADYAGLGSLPQSSCTKACTGSPAEDCGGSNAIQVFEYTTGGSGPTPTPPPMEPPSGDGVCYADKQNARILPDANNNVGGLTIASCKTICEADPTNAFYGVQYSKECWCGPDSSDISQHGLSAACTMPCSGNANEICGGSNAMNIYNMDSPPPSPGPSNTFIDGDCYADVQVDRIFPQSTKGIPDM